MILDVAKMRAICGIPSTVGAKSDMLNRCIEQAEDIDVKNLIGNSFMYLIDSVKSDYTLLLNGGKYTVDDVDYYFKGLNYVIAWFAFARWTKLSNSQPTAFGTVIKNSNDSDPISDANLIILINSYKATADKYMSDVTAFLGAQTDTKYSLFAGAGAENKEWHSRISIDTIQPD